MNTFEARSTLRDLVQEALPLVTKMARGEVPTFTEKQCLRRTQIEARALLSDAGYPGEVAWRALSRAGIGIDTMAGDVDPLFWHDVERDLQTGLEALEALVGPNLQRDIDIHVVG